MSGRSSASPSIADLQLVNGAANDRVDPDALSLQLPERPQYLAASPATTSHLLHPEAALLSEVLGRAARKRGRSIVIDGSLRDCAWAADRMKSLSAAGWEVEIMFVVSFALQKCRDTRKSS